MKKREELLETVNYLKKQGFTKPSIGVILGTGLGQMASEMEIEHEISYSDIPHFPESTVESHAGKLLIGTLAGKRTIMMSGRFHRYEGYDLWQITYGVRVMQSLGISSLLISNAAGAINLNYKKGDLMIVNDHINLQGDSPLAFKNVSEFGNMFADMLEPYSNKLNASLKNIALDLDIDIKEGVYAGVVGPQLETRAEYRMLQILEVDAVGMSTVPEVIVAKHLGLPCLAVSVLTDECDPKNIKPIDVADIISIAASAEPKLIQLFKELIKTI